MPFCKNCGNAMKDEQLFCTKCGTPADKKDNNDSKCKNEGFEPCKAFEESISEAENNNLNDTPVTEESISMSEDTAEDTSFAYTENASEEAASSAENTFDGENAAPAEAPAPKPCKLKVGYVVWSVINSALCFPLGITALIFAMLSKGELPPKAAKYNKASLILNIIATCFAVLLFILLTIVVISIIVYLSVALGSAFDSYPPNYIYPQI